MFPTRKGINGEPICIDCGTPLDPGFLGIINSCTPCGLLAGASESTCSDCGDLFEPGHICNLAQVPEREIPLSREKL
jgi:hypothetical protein